MLKYVCRLSHFLIKCPNNESSMILFSLSLTMAYNVLTVIFSSLVSFFDNVFLNGLPKVSDSISKISPSFVSIFLVKLPVAAPKK